MKKIMHVSFPSLLAVAFVTLFSCHAQVPEAELKNEIDSLSYTGGMMYGSQVERMFTQNNLEESNKADFIQGFQEGFQIDPKNKKENAFMIGKMLGHQMARYSIPYFNEQLFGQDSTKTISRDNFMAGYISMVKNDSSSLFTKEAAQTYVMNQMEIIRKSLAEKTYADAKKENIAFLEKNKSNKGVIVLPSGLQYKVVTKGKGPKPTAEDIVKVHYKGTNIKEETFDSSYERNEPAKLPIKNMIPGWTEGLQLMPVGSKYIFYIPSELAYGDKAQGSVITPFSTLIFEVELLEIVKKQKEKNPIDSKGIK